MIRLPQTDSHWHQNLCDTKPNQRPDQVIVSIDLTQGDFSPYWYVQVAYTLVDLAAELMDAEQCPYELKESKTGKTIGQVVIR